MNERAAEQKGLKFTGIYEHDRETAKARMENIRKTGFKVYLVTEPHNPLSRSSSGGGFSVYAEQRYFDEKERKDIQQELNVSIPSQRQHTKKKYEEEIAKIDVWEKYLLGRLAELTLKAARASRT